MFTAWMEYNDQPKLCVLCFCLHLCLLEQKNDPSHLQRTKKELASGR
jgi:hypothetical protein